MEADENTNEVRIMQASGTHKVYRLRENVEVDGVLMDTERAFAKLEEASREILANKNSLTCTNPNLYAQPLQYSIRGTEIEGFDTHKQIAQIPTPGDEFTYDGAFDGTVGSTSTTKVTASGVSYNVNTSTLVFFVPKDRNDEKAYAKISSPSVAFAVTKNRMVETFAIDTTKSGSPARMVIVYGLNPTLNFIGSSPYMVVSEIHGGAFDREYEGYVNGAKDIKTVAVSSNNFVTTIDGETNLVAADFVKKVDLIRYIIDNQGEIVAVKMLYDRSKGDTTKFEDGTNFVEADEGSGNNFYAALGVIEAKEDADKRIRVLADSERSFKYSDSTRIYKFDADGVLGEISIEEVHDGSLGQEKSRVIVISKSKVNDAAATVIYVIK